MTNRFLSLFFGLLSVTASISSTKAADAVSKKKNVLFIAVDDLRLQAGIFGQENMITPTLDKLGNEGVVFTRAYCSVPVCGASRASLMSGLRPTHNRFVNYNTSKDVDAPGVPSLAKWFKEHGYLTFSNGKIYHHTDDDLKAWSEPPFNPGRGKAGQKWGMYQTQESIDLINKYKKGPAYEAADVDDEGYPEGLLANKVVKDLEKLSKQDQPFFLSVGFWDPHLPFNAPKKYWDMYPEKSIKLADNPYKPTDAPDQAMHNWTELRNRYYNIPQQGPLDDETEKKLVHGYYACVTYIDTQIAKLLKALDDLGMSENTIVVLWGDHGWHLGEHTLWCKHCNFDRVMNAPLIVRVPGLTKGQKTHSITEFIDIYPSLCELCNLPMPSHLDGKSFVPVLKDPSVSVKDYAFVRYQQGESIITDQYTYTEWYNYPKHEADARMLYNLKDDPEENHNVSEKEENKGIVEKMSLLLENIRKESSN